MFITVHQSSSHHSFAMARKAAPQQPAATDTQPANDDMAATTAGTAVDGGADEGTNGATDANVELEEQKALSLQAHLQQVKDPAGLNMLRKLKSRLGQMRHGVGRQ